MKNIFILTMNETVNWFWVFILHVVGLHVTTVCTNCLLIDPGVHEPLFFVYFVMIGPLVNVINIHL